MLIRTGLLLLPGAFLLGPAPFFLGPASALRAGVTGVRGRDSGDDSDADFFSGDAEFAVRMQFTEPEFIDNDDDNDDDDAGELYEDWWACSSMHMAVNTLQAQVNGQVAFSQAGTQKQFENVCFHCDMKDPHYTKFLEAQLTGQEFAAVFADIVRLEDEDSDEVEHLMTVEFDDAVPVNAGLDVMALGDFADINNSVGGSGRVGVRQGGGRRRRRRRRLDDDGGLLDIVQRGDASICMSFKRFAMFQDLDLDDATELVTNRGDEDEGEADIAFDLTTNKLDDDKDRRRRSLQIRRKLLRKPRRRRRRAVRGRKV